jgi:hypothetical protein
MNPLAGDKKGRGDQYIQDRTTTSDRPAPAAQRDLLRIRRK